MREGHFIFKAYQNAPLTLKCNQSAEVVQNYRKAQLLLGHDVHYLIKLEFMEQFETMNLPGITL